MQLLKLVIVFLLLSQFVGCASAARMESMIFLGEQKSFPDELESNLSLLAVAGGKETNPIWSSQISNESFSGALKASLEKQGLYSNDGQFQLFTTILDVKQPILGFSFTVTTYIEYKLNNKISGNTLFHETIVATHTVSVKEEFYGVERLRLANEGSGKENITLFLERIAELDLPLNDVSISLN